MSKEELPQSDEEAIAAMREHPYLRWVSRHVECSHKPPFDPSPFVTIRKRLGEEALGEMKSNASPWSRQPKSGMHRSRKPLGRPPEQGSLDVKAQQKRRKYESGPRKQVEGKGGYDLALVKAKATRARPGLVRCFSG